MAGGGDVTPVNPAMAKIWEIYGPPPGMPTVTPAPVSVPAAGDDGRYVEHGGRIYEVVTVDGYPTGDDGRERKCVIDVTNQRLLFARHLTPAERADLLRRAFVQWEQGRRKPA